MDRESKIEYISLGILLGFTLSILLSLFYVSTYHPHYTLFYLLTQYYPFLPFGDFLDVYYAISNNSPYKMDGEFPSIPYFPFSFLLANFFKQFHPTVASYLFIFIYVATFIAFCNEYLKVNHKATQLKNVLIFSFLSYPFLLALQRANYDIVVFIFVALFIYTFHIKKWRLLNVAALACAISIKLYPAAFLILYISEKRFTDLLSVLVLTLLITIMSYAGLEGGLIQNMHAHLVILDKYSFSYAFNNNGLAFGHSLYGAIKTILAYFNSANYNNAILLLYKSIPYFSFSLFFLLSVYIIRYENVFWKKMALLVFSVCLLPHVSNDYKLLLVYLPLFLFINEKNKQRSDPLYTLLFVLVLIPKELFLNANQTSPAFALINLGVIITPFVMLITMLTIIGETVLVGFRKIHYSHWESLWKIKQKENYND